MRRLPLVTELSPPPDPIRVLRAFADRPGTILLESALVRVPVGRYSFLAADPFAFVESPSVRHGEDPFESVCSRLRPFSEQAIPELPPFQGGAAGLLSYDLGRAWERIPPPRRDEFQLPALAVGLYDWTIAWDHAAGRAWIVSQGFPERDPNRRTDRAAARMRFVLDRLRGERGNGREGARRVRGDSVSADRLAPQWPAPGLEGLTSNFSRDAYLRAVERAIDDIFAGDVFQVNLSQRLLFPQVQDSLRLYERLRQVNPAPFAGYFAHRDWAVASASPERFVCVRRGTGGPTAAHAGLGAGDGAGQSRPGAHLPFEVETRPIKGTRRRRSGPEADLFTRDELRESEKDQAENVMIVDLLRNDLSRVCAPGSIRVPKLCSVETYETVQHLVSEVRGRLAPGRDVWDLLAAVFPGGSITGAPKVRAMEIIAELEPTARGPYCGSLFYAGFDGSADSSILIRTFTCRGGWIQCPVGGGIVAQSDPRAEYEETLHKAAGMLRALRDEG